MSTAAPNGVKAGTVVAHDIEQRIVRRQYSAGQALPTEADLVKQYGVSRAVLREAMRLLETDGLVSIRRGLGGGSRVNAPDAATTARYTALVLQHAGTTVADLDTASFALEAEGMWLLARQQPAGGTAVLHQVLDATDTSEPGSISDFHSAIAPASGNAILIGLFEVLNEVRARHARAAVFGSTDRDSVARDLQTAHAFHRRAVTVIEAGDAERIRGQWQRHARVVVRALAHDPAQTVLDLFQSPFADPVGSGGARRPARLPKGSDIVANEIRQGIVTGRLREGDALPTEVELMEQYGLSRSPIREAVRVLEAERLVTTRRGSHNGGLVRTPSIEVAARRFGILMEYQAASVGQLVDAWQLVARAAASLLTGSRLDGINAVAIDITAGPVRAAAVGDVVTRLGDVVAAAGNVTLSSLYGLAADLLRRQVPGALRNGRPGKDVRQAAERSNAALDVLRGGAGDIDARRDAWLELCDATAGWLGVVLADDIPVSAFA
jgi:DNA-binding FadR family transcriptional regulator